MPVWIFGHYIRNIAIVFPNKIKTLIVAWLVRSCTKAKVHSTIVAVNLLAPGHNTPSTWQ